MLSMSVKVEHAVTIRDGSHCAGAASPDDMRSKDGRVRALPWPRLREGYLSPGLFILLGIPRDFDGGEGGGYVGGEPIERMMSMWCAAVAGWPHDGHVVCAAPRRLWVRLTSCCERC